MDDPSILVVAPDRKTQRTVHRILGATGFRVELADSVEQGTHAVQHHAPLVVVFDERAATEPGAEALLAAARTRGAEACVTLLTASAAATPRGLGLGAITNLLVHPMPILAEELMTTVHKLFRRDLFGAEKYLLWGTQLSSHTITRASQRAPLVAHVADELRARGQSARVASMAMLVADELISNAVHNAPVDAGGGRYRRDTPRDVELELEEREQVQLRWGCDARYVAIEVNDRFGSLDRDTILSALHSEQVRASGGGAGMGVALCYRSCDHLVFNTRPGARTEVIALIDVRPPPTERPTGSSYNVFIERAP